MLAAITPPVATGSFLASNIAGARPMKTGWQSMRLGIVIYFIPFFFVFNPALVLRGPPLETVYCIITCALGVALLAGGLEGYLLGIGKVMAVARPFLVIAGLLLGFPEWRTDGIGAILALVIITLLWVRRRTRLKETQSSL
jgi:TRAP-type uncharacterized transport system fused permease subunit